ncbi:MFS transporter [Sphingomonas sp. GlSt437]|uniref:MFS transporter n=1 Tax=Sphingomonas sp. GlSt437 TaxID=3389970 RepID=UPI003A85A892
MLNALGLLKERRFLPIFVTQFLGAFNDNLFKTAMVLFVTYKVYNDPQLEQNFNALATGLSLIPFFLLSALSGQLADTIDKARIIRIVKTAEIGIMVIGAAGLMIARAGQSTLGIALMLTAVLLLGVHSTFFGPIKYAILPQHLREDEVLGGTGLVEAGTYLAILMGTVIAGWIEVEAASIMVLCVAGIGWVVARNVAPAPRMGKELSIDLNPISASWRLVNATMHIPRLFMAICSISFFWAIGAVLIITFPPLVKNLLTADKEVASLVIALFSIGVAVGSVIINTLLGGKISAKYAPGSVIAMGVFLVAFSLLARNWIGTTDGHLYTVSEFIAQPRALLVVGSLTAIAVTGGMYVVPLYAFLTTTVSKDQTSRTVAANNIVNAGAMVTGALIVIALTAMGVTPQDMMLIAAACCLVAAWLGQRLHQLCD